MHIIAILFKSLNVYIVVVSVSTSKYQYISVSLFLLENTTNIYKNPTKGKLS